MSTPPTPPDQLYRVPHAADRLALQPSTLRKMITYRKIAVIRIGRSVRIPAAEIERIQREGLQPRRAEGRP
jgi:excisionase family DNA binding protein